MPEPRYVEFADFTGVDARSNAVALPPGKTRDALNVMMYPGGLGKRPGLVLWGGTVSSLTAGATGSRIYHMKRASLITGTGVAGTVDALFLIHSLAQTGGVLHSRVSFVDLFSNTAVALTGESAMVAPAAAPWFITDRRVSVVDRDRLHISGDRFGTANGAFWIQNSVTYFEANTTSMPPAQYLSHALHRQTIVAGASALADNVHRIRWSATGAPTSWPAVNDEQLKVTGRLGRVQGVVEDSDALYILCSDSVWMITGASPEVFRIERIADGIGGGDPDSATVVNGTVIGFATQAFVASWQNGWQEVAAPYNVMTIQGGVVRTIGNEIAPYLMQAAAKYSTVSQMRVEHAPQWQTVLLHPNANTHHGYNAAGDLFAYQYDRQAFWPWRFSPTIAEGAFCWTPKPSSLTTIGVQPGSLVWVGGRDAGSTSLRPALYYMHEDAVDDAGSYFDSYWTSAPTAIPDDATGSLESVTVWGVQAGGGPITISVSVEGGAFTAAGTANLPTVAAAVADFAAPGAVTVPMAVLGGTRGKSVRFRVDFARDGVRQRIAKIVTGIKVMGR